VIMPSDADWDEVVTAAALEVVGWAGRGECTYYSDLADAVNREVPDAELSRHGHAMNRLLFDLVVTARAFDGDAPMLSAVVVLKNQNNRQPGSGFWQLGKELGLYSGSPREEDKAGFWGQQFAANSQFWTASRVREFRKWLGRNGPTLYRGRVPS
jgi:hypothetical protein